MIPLAQHPPKIMIDDKRDGFVGMKRLDPATAEVIRAAIKDAGYAEINGLAKVTIVIEPKIGLDIAEDKKPPSSEGGLDQSGASAQKPSAQPTKPTSW